VILAPRAMNFRRFHGEKLHSKCSGVSKPIWGGLNNANVVGNFERIPL